jgi:hypothetical protein
MHGIGIVNMEKSKMDVSTIIIVGDSHVRCGARIAA